MSKILLKLPNGKHIIEHWDDGMSVVWQENGSTCQAKIEGTALELFNEIKALREVVEAQEALIERFEKGSISGDATLRATLVAAKLKLEGGV